MTNRELLQGRRRGHIRPAHPDVSTTHPLHEVVEAPLPRYGGAALDVAALANRVDDQRPVVVAVVVAVGRPAAVDALECGRWEQFTSGAGLRYSTSRNQSAVGPVGEDEVGAGARPAELREPAQMSIAAPNACPFSPSDGPTAWALDSVRHGCPKRRPAGALFRAHATSARTASICGTNLRTVSTPGLGVWPYRIFRIVAAGTPDKAPRRSIWPRVSRSRDVRISSALGMVMSMSDSLPHPVCRAQPHSVQVAIYRGRVTTIKDTLRANLTALLEKEAGRALPEGQTGVTALAKRAGRVFPFPGKTRHPQKVEHPQTRAGELLDWSGAWGIFQTE